MRRLFWMAMGLLLSLSAAEARDAGDVLQGTPNGLALTPPMGWNSWNKFGCEVNEKVIRAAADATVSSGMRDAGYQYIVIDDCWQGARDKHGNIQPDPKRFPSGIKKLADYVHSKGLKFGIYSDAGTKTCGGRPGSRGFEYQDSKQYAAWGIDYLKYDWCNVGTQDAAASYLAMSQALQSTGRPIVFSLCEWGNSKPWLWARNIGNLWRTTGDIYDHWEGKNSNGYSIGMMNIVDMQAGLEGFAGPGHWNDPDMLEIGNGGMTDTEYRTHMSLWSMLAAPLLAGHDVRTMSDAIKEILLNREVIAIDQDKAGHQGFRVRQDGELEVWKKPLAEGVAVALFNRGKDPAKMTVKWSEVGVTGPSPKVRDLWAHKDIEAPVEYTAEIASHGVVMLKVN